MLKNGQTYLKILRCEHCKIFKESTLCITELICELMINLKYSKMALKYTVFLAIIESKSNQNNLSLQSNTALFTLSFKKENLLSIELTSKVLTKLWVIVFVTSVLFIEIKKCYCHVLNRLKREFL